MWGFLILGAWALLTAAIWIFMVAVGKADKHGSDNPDYEEGDN